MNYLCYYLSKSTKVLYFYFDHLFAKHPQHQVQTSLNYQVIAISKKNNNKYLLRQGRPPNYSLNKYYIIFLELLQR